MRKTRIVIADDHALIRSGLRSLLAEQPDLEVAGEAADGAEVIATCQRLSPEVVLMDLLMPGCGGLPAIRELKRACPATNVLVVTMHEDLAYVRSALLEGASGYVLKRSLASELLTAIRAVRNGQKHITRLLPQAVAESTSTAAHSHPNHDALDLLSSRELEVLIQVALGHTSSEIAQALHISPNTVETHRRNILKKLGLQSRADLVRLALTHRLIGQ